MDNFYVYQWRRPDTGAVFYVGKGRGYRDVASKTNNPIFIRITEKLKQSGLAPVIERTHCGLTEAEAFAIERQEIARYGRINNKTGTLSNLTDGGEGSSGWVPSAETRANISKAKTGKTIRPLSAEGRKNLSNSLRGKPKSSEHKAKMSAVNLGKTISAETRAKISIANTGRKTSEETRAKLSASQIGKTIGDETRAKIGAANRGKKHTAEARARMSEAHAGRPHSEEHVENITKALRMNPTVSTSKSGLKGVTQRGNRWVARITINGRREPLGTFGSPAEAGLAYDRAAVGAWGLGNCYRNFPDEVIAC